MSFSMENVEERVSEILGLMGEKFECDRDDDEAIQLGIFSLFLPDGRSVVDINYCCGRHLLMAVAVIKEAAEKLLEERQFMTEDEIAEEWEFAQENAKDSEDLGSYSETIDDDGWLGNIDL